MLLHTDTGTNLDGGISQTTATAGTFYDISMFNADYTFSFQVLVLKKKDKLVLKPPSQPQKVINIRVYYCFDENKVIPYG